MYKFLFFILLSFNSLTSFAQPQWYVYNTSNSGLPQDYSRQIAIDSNNVKWIVSYGLVRFDGYNWRVFNTSNSPLTSNDILCVAVDKNNDVWLGTNGNGTYRYRQSDSTWTRFGPATSGIPSATVSYIYVDKINNKWLCTTGFGLTKYNDTNFSVYKTTNSAIPSNMAFRFVIDRNNVWWVGFWYGGLASFNGTNWTLYDTTNTPNIPSNIVRTIAVDSNNVKWIGCEVQSLGKTFRGGLSTFNDTSWVKLDSTNSPFTRNGNNNVQCVSVDKYNTKWICTEYEVGLYKLENNNTWTSYTSLPLPDNFLRHVIIDKFNNKWISHADQGVSLFNETGIVKIINNEESVTSKNYILYQNYPNPFNPSTTIKYSLQKPAFIELNLYDVAGKFLKTIDIGFKVASNYSVIFDPGNVSSGVYYYSLLINGERLETRKAIFLK